MNIPSAGPGHEISDRSIEQVLAYWFGQWGTGWTYIEQAGRVNVELDLAVRRIQRQP